MNQMWPSNFMEKINNKWNFYLCITLGFFFIFFNAVYSLDLTIDNRLFVNPSDCYKRVTIGSRIADSLSITSIDVNALTDCELACSFNGTSCVSFSFGVGAVGNSTCILGRSEPENSEETLQDPDYDTYLKGKISLIGCRTNNRNRNRLNINLPSTFNDTSSFNSSFNFRPLNSSSVFNRNNNSNRIFGDSSLFNIIGNGIFNRNINRTSPSVLRNFQYYLDPPNDEKTRIYDILKNKKNHPVKCKAPVEPSSIPSFDFHINSPSFSNHFPKTLYYDEYTPIKFPHDSFPALDFYPDFGKRIQKSSFQDDDNFSWRSNEPISVLSESQEVDETKWKAIQRKCEIIFI